MAQLRLRVLMATIVWVMAAGDISGELVSSMVATL